MDPGARAELEQRVRDAVERGDVSSAVTSTLEGYGPELFGFLMAVHPDEADAQDAFSELAEGVWLGLTTFAWESTLRTWVYAIARNIMRANRRKAARRERRVARVGDSAIEAVAAKVRTETPHFPPDRAAHAGAGAPGCVAGRGPHSPYSPNRPTAGLGRARTRDGSDRTGRGTR